MTTMVGGEEVAELMIPTNKVGLIIGMVISNTCTLLPSPFSYLSKRGYTVSLYPQGKEEK